VLPSSCGPADIARQRVIVEHALDAAYSSKVAESTLYALEGAFRMFEKHRGLILDQLRRLGHTARRIVLSLEGLGTSKRPDPPRLEKACGDLPRRTRGAGTGARHDQRDSYQETARR
jgi:hypothetical protein